MQQLVKMITPVEWVSLAIALVALIIALMAWRRAGRALKLANKTPEIKIAHDDVVQQEESLPQVSLEISADKNEFDQVTLKLVNTGELAAKIINITIDNPENIYDTEGLSEGSAIASINSAITPKLAILDAENRLPVKEILPGKSLDLPAALTMSHGKISDYPVTLRWKDEEGSSQQMQITLTV